MSAIELYYAPQSTCLLGLDKMWADRPGVSSWWQRVRNRPSTEETIWKRMTVADWAPFKNVQPDPWPKVRGPLAVASAKGVVPWPAMPSN